MVPTCFPCALYTCATCMYRSLKGTVQSFTGKQESAAGEVQVRVKIGAYSKKVTLVAVNMSKEFDIIMGERWLKDEHALLNMQKNCMVLRKGKPRTLHSRLAAFQQIAKHPPRKAKIAVEVGHPLLLNAAQVKKDLRREAQAFWVLGSELKLTMKLKRRLTKQYASCWTSTLMYSQPDCQWGRLQTEAWNR